jgi:hypothetical protein
MKREKYLLLKNLDKELIQLFEESKCILAGGALTSIFSGKPIHDYDIYFTQQNHNKVNNILDKKKIDKAVITDCASTFKLENCIIQSIMLNDMVVEKAEELFLKFDFTICQAAYNFNTKEMILGENFLKHLSQRRLVFNTNTEYPLASLFRVKKFMKRGFNISGTDMIKIGLKVHSLNIYNYQELKKQILGVDTLFLKELLDTLQSDEYAEKKYEFDQFLEVLENHVFSQWDTEE